jgi:hypothetical protein
MFFCINVYIFSQAKHIGHLHSFDKECQALNESKLIRKRKTQVHDTDVKLKQPKILACASLQITSKMLDEYVLVSVR